MKLNKNIVISLGSLFTILTAVIPVSASHAGGGLHYDGIGMTAGLLFTGYLILTRVKTKLTK